MACCALTFVRAHLCADVLIERCAVELLPAKAWQERFCDEFSRLRQASTRKPVVARRCVCAHARPCVVFCGGQRVSRERKGGRVVAPGAPAEAQTGETHARGPTWRALAAMTEVSARPISHVCLCVCERESARAYANAHTWVRAWPMHVTLCSQAQVLAELRSRVDAVTRGEALAGELAAWLYALLAVIELPLDREACGCIRDLLRACAHIRASQLVSCE